jgi:6-phosphofructokinase
MGVNAVKFLLDGKSGVMTAMQGRKIEAVPIEDCIREIRPISESYFEMQRFLSR